MGVFKVFSPLGSDGCGSAPVLPSPEVRSCHHSRGSASDTDLRLFEGSVPGGNQTAGKSLEHP